MGLCDRVAVLDYGRKIAEGLPPRPERPGRHRGLPGRGAAMILLAVDRLAVHYGGIRAVQG